ncbi:MAG: PTH1 family peptidyl-tRNA hydrolase [Candidatus Latescibacterota bacterium]
MQIVLGLGNPGPRYEDTRHNIGFILVDYLASRAQVDWVPSARDHSHVAEIDWSGQSVLLAKPQTYMNRSGRAVKALCTRYEVEPSSVLVVYDDFLIDFGRLRLRRRGSDGGHNGLASVLEELASQDLPRLRLGIGQPPQGTDIIDYVLAPFSGGKGVEELVQRGVAALDLYFAEGVEAAMNRFNGVP